jgi:hypothetical protein
LSADDFTILHEFGHALGFVHEHQRADAPCYFHRRDLNGYDPRIGKGRPYYRQDIGRWALPSIYTHYKWERPPRTREDERRLNHWINTEIIPQNHTNPRLASRIDPTSIMFYPIPKFLFRGGKCGGVDLPKEITYRSDLSGNDIAVAQRAYPRTNPNRR